ncbi:hypothetical protein PISL3812_09753 [Talaromyces islandicus]|uniref:carbonic anhydrase n=1 Tax=Talaromyces islandicus TaxID=28573 RepID=A0A0U1MAR1_TALIS|nr:hypothetical protein PISL3812_09753 [Talaromyces islandicus]
MKFSACVLSLMTAIAAFCVHAAGLDYHEHNPISASFNYTGLGGPLNWHGLDRTHNYLCAKGRYQSPINIDSSIRTAPRGVALRIPPDTAVFENLGSTIEVTLHRGYLFTPTGRYTLRQFHFHTPSEHRINEEYYPLEVHFVFKGHAGSTAVVGFLFELTESRRGYALFEDLFSQVHKIASPGTSVRTSRLMFKDLAWHLESNPVYQYPGSLTTPPCTEGVAWFISAKPLPLSVKMYNAVKHVLKFNARYTQSALGEKNLLAVAAAELDETMPDFESVRAKPNHGERSIKKSFGPWIIAKSDHMLAMVSERRAAIAQPNPDPSGLQAREVPTSELSQFKFWVQYAAAAYCESNYVGQAGTKLACWANNCPEVESAEATIVYDFSNTTTTDTSGFVALDKTNKAIILSFRGSYSVRNWISDVEFPLIDPGLCDSCLAEFGFWSSWEVVREPISAVIKESLSTYPDYELIVVGHSLGAAVATLAATDLRSKGHLSTALYAFAAPRVANRPLAAHITAQGNNYRFTHTDDPVPKLPLLSMGYVHVSPEYYITSPNNVTVSTEDIKVLEGDVNFEGNTGTGLPSLDAFSAHHWYFEEADGCIGPGLPFR